MQILISLQFSSLVIFFIVVGVECIGRGGGSRGSGGGSRGSGGGSRGSGGGSRGATGGRTIFSGGKSHSSSSRFGHYSRRGSYFYGSSVSKTKYKVVFPTTHSLSYIYISPGMSSHVHLHSHQDLYRYAVCEGVIASQYNKTGTNRTYTHFICPDNLFEPEEVNCCYYKHGEGFCCLPYKKHYLWIIGVVLGGFFMVLIIVVVCGVIVRRCRRRRQLACSVQTPKLSVHSSTPSIPEDPLMPSDEENDNPTPFAPTIPMPPANLSTMGTGWNPNSGQNVYAPPASPPDAPPPPPYPGLSNVTPYPTDEHKPLMQYRGI